MPVMQKEDFLRNAKKARHQREYSEPMFGPELSLVLFIRELVYKVSIFLSQNGKTKIKYLHLSRDLAKLH